MTAVRRPSTWIWLRRSTQTLILLTLSYSLWTTRYPLESFFSAAWFFQIDPLVMGLTAAAERLWLPGLGWTLLVLILTLVLGRWFCGWFCPLGALQDAAAAVLGRFRLRGEGKPGRPLLVKYGVLAVLIVLAVAGIQLAWLLDPITIFVRAFSFTLHPWAVRSADGAFAAVLQSTGFPLWLEQIYSVAKARVLETSLPVFPHTVWIFSLFALVLLAVGLRRRFWCRYVCPLGALLGLAARWSPLRRIAESCPAGCRTCRQVCRTQAIQDDNSTLSQECILCLECLDTCPGRRSTFAFTGWPFRPKPEPGSPPSRGITRAQFLALTAGAALSGCAKTRGGAPAERTVIRPPAALPETEFVQRCIRCGNCMKVCLTNVLQPAAWESGWEGVWTPRLEPRIAYCEYHCTLCGQVCPTGALPPLTVEEKVRTRLGLAVVDRTRCIPWAYGNECLVCEEHCPVPNKAIKVETFVNKQGKTVGRPVVDAALCVGCAICENKCPVKQVKAIRVQPL